MSEHQLKSVLVPLDGTPLSEQAIPFALAIAGAGGSVTLIQVTPDAEPLRKPFGAITMTAEEVRTMLGELAGSDLERAAGHWQDLANDVSFESEVRSGDATTVLLEVADQKNVDLIALASAGRGALGRLALGSVTDRLVRSSDKPVLVVRETDADPVHELPKVTRIIVPLDGSDRAALAIPIAAALSKQLQAAVHVLTAVDLPQIVSPAMAYGPAFSLDFYADLEAETEKNARVHLDEAVKAFASHEVEATPHVLMGSAVAAIDDFASPGDLVVMTSRGQGGFKRWVLGSVTERLIRDSPAPILVVPSHHHE